MKIIASYTEPIVVYNSTIHISACKWFFIEVKKLHGWKFSPLIFPSFSKKSLISLTFPDHLTNSDFPWLPWPSGNPVVVWQSA